MLFSEDFKNLVKSSINIDLIGKDIPLHQKGDNYRGTIGKAGNSGKSLVVTLDRQLWRNTKGRKGGDVFDWIAFDYGLDRDSNFLEIIRIAADFAGILLEGLSKEDKKVKKVHEKAERWNQNLRVWHTLKETDLSLAKKIFLTFDSLFDVRFEDTGFFRGNI